MGKIMLLSFLLFSTTFLFAQKDDRQWQPHQLPGKSKGFPVISPWHSGTAGIIKNNGAELSLFNPSRIGMTKNTELLFRIGEEWVLPNIGIKHRWWGNDRFIFSTEHTLYYPWPLLKLLQTTGIKDLVPDSAKIKQGIAMRNELLFSWLLNRQIAGCPDAAAEKVLTLRAGLEFYAGENSRIQPFDWFHTLYHTQIFDKKILYYGGLQFDSYFSNRFHYSLNALYYSVDFSKDYALEANARLTYYVSKRIGISAACKAAYMKIALPSSAPALPVTRPAQWSILPLLDVTYLIRPDRGEIQHGLFRKNRKRR